jgi:hypothetical protein
VKRSSLVAIAFAACAHAPPPTPPADPPPARRAYGVAEIRADVESLLALQADAYWKSWTTGAALDLAAGDAPRRRLLAPDALASVKEALAKASGDERRALAHLESFLLGEALSEATAGPVERLVEAEAQAAFSWEGRQVPLRDLLPLLASEPDAPRRAAIEKAHAAAAASLVPLAEAEASAVAAAARKLGYPGALALAGGLRAQVPGALASLAEAVLAATEEPYRDLVDDLARRELSLSLSELRSRDWPRLLRLAHEARAFPAARLVEDGTAALSGLGLDPKALPGLAVDAEARPGKSPRPLMLPLEVPGKVRVSAIPAGGHAESSAFLHELGAGAYYAGVRAAEVEFRRLGPASGPETWGRLLAGLTGDPAWLAERAGLSNHALGREVRAALAERLHAARLSAARLLAEVERGNPSRAAGADARLLSRALCRPVEAEEARRWPLARDPLLGSAEVLRAQLLAAQAEAFLAKRAGTPAWWRSKENGEWLARTWAAGSRLGPEELSLAMGYAALDPAALAAVARARIQAAGQ